LTSAKIRNNYSKFKISNSKLLLSETKIVRNL
jgi:hypothetical protein